MSHTHRTTGGTAFIFNSDLSGDVEIVRGDRRASVPGACLISFAAEMLKRKAERAADDAGHEAEMEAGNTAYIIRGPSFDPVYRKDQ